MLIVISAVTAIVIALIHWLIARKRSVDARRIIELFLLYIVVLFFGVAHLISGIQLLTRPDRIAAYIGWPGGTPFLNELGLNIIGLSVISIMCIWLRGIYFMAPVVGNTIALSGAAILHINDIVQHGNTHPGNAGLLLYAEIIMPVLAFVLMIFYFRLSRKRFEARE